MLPVEMRHLRTGPWSGQAAVESASIVIASCLPLRGSVSTIQPQLNVPSVQSLIWHVLYLEDAWQQ
jgi:uncharacterized damage-inducible protein DinB